MEEEGEGQPRDQAVAIAISLYYSILRASEHHRLYYLDSGNTNNDNDENSLFTPLIDNTNEHNENEEEEEEEEEDYLRSYGWMSELLRRRRRVGFNYNERSDSSSLGRARQARERRRRRREGKLFVYVLRCKCCSKKVCIRGMRVHLVANSCVKLFSSDKSSKYTSSFGEIYKAQHCECGIQDTACMHCGARIGYHVVTPCTSCQESENNGHYWMFNSEEVLKKKKIEQTTGKPMSWTALWRYDAQVTNDDDELISTEGENTQNDDTKDWLCEINVGR